MPFVRYVERYCKARQATHLYKNIIWRMRFCLSSPETLVICCY